MASDAAVRILDDLRRRGVRITKARREVVDALVASDGHLNAEDITSVVQQRAPEIHLSTVYRTLEALAQIDVVDAVHVGHGGAVYHLADNRHQHLVCERCGAVLHVADGLLDALADDIYARYRFMLRSHHVALTGVCERCSG